MKPKVLIFIYMSSIVMFKKEDAEQKNVIFEESLNILWDKLAAREISPVLFLSRITKFKLIQEGRKFTNYISRIDSLQDEI